MNKDHLQTLARDLRKTPPRSPGETLDGFVIATRMLDKARADWLGLNRDFEYPFDDIGCHIQSAFFSKDVLEPLKRSRKSRRLAARRPKGT